MNFWSEQLLFYLSIILTMILPGWFLFNAFFPFDQSEVKSIKQTNFKSTGILEKFSLAIGLSIVSIDFLILLLNKIGLSFNLLNVLSAIILFILFCWLLSHRVTIPQESKEPEIYNNSDFKLNNLKILVSSLTLLLLGPLWALSSPQTKFVSGGVVGNVIGNLLIPLALYFYLRSFQEKNRSFLIMGILTTTGLFYTHHLSSFIFLFIIAFTFLSYSLFSIVSYFFQRNKWINPIFTIINDSNQNYSKSENKLEIKSSISNKTWDFEQMKKKSFLKINQKFINTFLIILILLVTVFIRSIYLKKSIFPTATDLGHHLYWSSKITSTKHIPFYQKDVIVKNKDNHYQLINKPIADFIVGEHLIFAVIHLITKISYISYFPELILFLINLNTLLVIFFLTYRILPNNKKWLWFQNVFLEDNSKNNKIPSSIIPTWKLILKNYGQLVFNSKIIFFLLGLGLLIYYINLPTYLQVHAVNTVIGKPSKITRVGLSWTEIKYFLSEPRLVLALMEFLTLIILTFLRRFYLLGSGLLIGWSTSLFLMTWQPQWLHINIPSGRISTYLIFPVSILSAIAFFTFFVYRKKASYLILILGYLFLNTLLFYGTIDNFNALKSTKSNKNQSALATFHSAKYLTFQTNNKQVNIVKDHNHIIADTWIKLFFKKDYNYPLSRSYFKRYNDKTKPREQCTLWVISEPNSSRAQQCFNDLNIKYIVINPNYDDTHFKDKPNFWKIYDNQNITIYYRP